MMAARKPVSKFSMVSTGRKGAAHILLLVLVFMFIAGYLFLKNQKVDFSKGGIIDFKKEKQPSASGVVFSTEQEPASRQAERYYRDQNARKNR